MFADIRKSNEKMLSAKVISPKKVGRTPSSYWEGLKKAEYLKLKVGYSYIEMINVKGKFEVNTAR